MSSAPAARSEDALSHSTPGALSHILTSPAFIVGAAFALRMTLVLIGRLYHFVSPSWDAFEMANIGRSIVQGQGFSSPFGVPTGPTAWTAPLYPYVVAAVFRIFGVFSDASGLVLLTFNSAFSALTCWTIYRIGERMFNRKVAQCSAWIWAIFPLSVYFAVSWVWETSFSTFLLSAIFLLTLNMEGDARLWTWSKFAALWAVVALTNTSIIAWLPFAGSWLAYQLYRQGKSFAAPVIVSAVVFWTCITPWIVRNYMVFDKFLLIRGDIGSELSAGNNPMASGTWVGEYRAGNNPKLLAQYKQMGEIAFDAEQANFAKHWIAESPSRFFSLCGRKFFFFWAGLTEPPLGLFTNPVVGLLSVTALGGLLLGLKKRISGMFLFASLLFAYPLVYYITFTTNRYRHPIEPELVILAVWLFCAPNKRSRAQAQNATE